MKHATIGKTYNQNKTAPIECVKRDTLQTVDIQYDCFLLVLLLKGSLKFTVGTQTYTASAPSFVCFSEQENPIFTKPKHALCSTVYFHPQFLNCNMNFDLLRNIHYEDIAANHDLFLLKPFVDGPRIIPISETSLDAVEAAFEGLCTELDEQRDWYWSCRSRSYFMELMIALERMYGRMSYGEATQAPNVSVDVQDKRLKAAVLFIESHYNTPLTLADVTQEIGVNRATLLKLFKQECGMTFAEYVKAYRLRVAQKHLLFTELPIKEIALRCGFKTVPHFSRCIKDETGMTPAQYRKNEVMRRKEALQQETLPVVDVVLDEVTGNHMYYTAREHFTQIVKIGFWFDQGDLQALSTQKRWSFFDVIDPENCVAELEKEYTRNVDCLRKHAEKGFPIRIWRTCATAHHVCIFAYLCDVLQTYNCPIEVIDHPNTELKCWGLLGECEKFEDFLPLAKPLDKTEMAHHAALWHRIREENTMLRVLENGEICSVDETYFDEQLLPFLPSANDNIAWIDEIAARPFLDLEYFDWHRYRIRTFIKNGTLEHVPLRGLKSSNIIRHKQSTKQLSIADLRLIGCANLPAFPNDKPAHLPEAQVWVLLSTTGAVYVVQNDDTERLLQLLTTYNDTQIAVWVTLWWHNRTLDLPSFASRKALLELNPANADTCVPLHGFGSINEKCLGDTLS